MWMPKPRMIRTTCLIIASLLAAISTVACVVGPDGEFESVSGATGGTGGTTTGDPFAPDPVPCDPAPVCTNASECCTLNQPPVSLVSYACASDNFPNNWRCVSGECKQQWASDANPIGCDPAITDQRRREGPPRRPRRRSTHALRNPVDAPRPRPPALLRGLGHAAVVGRRALRGDLEHGAVGRHAQGRGRGDVRCIQRELTGVIPVTRGRGPARRSRPSPPRARGTGSPAGRSSRRGACAPPLGREPPS